MLHHNPSCEKIPLHMELEFQHGPKWKGSSGSCVNLPLNKAVGLCSSFQRDECEMPKSAFHTLLEEESELKQHDCVFKPETCSALEQNAGVCCPFEGKPGCKRCRCTERRFETSSRFSETYATINAQFYSSLESAYLRLWGLSFG